MKKVYLLALIGALITAFGVYQLVDGIEERAKSQVQGAQNVVVATEKIGENVIIEEKMLQIKQVSSELVSAGVATNISEVVGKVSKSPTDQGEPIYKTRLFDVGTTEGQQLSYELPKGLRAVSMTVDNVIGVSNYIRQGDRVDLVATFNKDDNKTSKIAFENLLVLRVGTEKESKDAKDGGQYTTVTLAVTPEQAVELNYTIANALVRLILRSPMG